MVRPWGIPVYNTIEIVMTLVQKGCLHICKKG
jgi:hypothetical protein